MPRPIVLKGNFAAAQRFPIQNHAGHSGFDAIRVFDREEDAKNLDSPDWANPIGKTGPLS